jgi:GNAT superfamily N-acetyltransferase
MDHQTDSYRIRLARPDEVPRLREIEDEAGTIFSGLGLIDEALDVSFPLDDLARLVGMGQVWVGCLADGLPVGMVIASVREGMMYVEEMDVLPAHGRRGLGARLLARVCAQAQAQGHPAVTLSTFRDVPWNGPFYRKHGFRDLQPVEWTPGMRTIRENEAQHGLRVEARVFMRRELGGVGLPDSPGEGWRGRRNAPSNAIDARPGGCTSRRGESVVTDQEAI